MAFLAGIGSALGSTASSAGSAVAGAAGSVGSGIAEAAKGAGKEMMGSFADKGAPMLGSASPGTSPTMIDNALGWLSRANKSMDQAGISAGGSNMAPLMMPQQQNQGQDNSYMMPMGVNSGFQQQPYVPIQPGARRGNMDWLAFLGKR